MTNISWNSSKTSKDTEIKTSYRVFSIYERASGSLVTSPFQDILNHSMSIQPTVGRNYKIDALCTGPLAPPFARSLAPLTYLLSSHCSRAPLRLFIRSLESSGERDSCQSDERLQHSGPGEPDRPSTFLFIISL